MDADGPGNPAARDVTVQAVCGSKPGKITPPHQTTFVSPGETKTLTMTCQRQARAHGRRLPAHHRPLEQGRRDHPVAGHLRQGLAGHLARPRRLRRRADRIAYCIKSKQPVLQEVSATVPLATNSTATATTPRCSGGRKPAFGGFKTASTGDVMYFGGYFTTGGTWAATAFNEGPPTTLEAYMYCIRPFSK